jgi:1-Cys peroxiredoxin 6
MILLGDIFPNLRLHTSKGEFDMHEYIGDSWCILFSHPHDFTPVCTTELAKAAKLAPEFAKRNVKMLALSCNDIEMHKAWIKDIAAYGNLNLDTDNMFPYPIIDDKARIISLKLGMMDPNELDSAGAPLTARAVILSTIQICFFFTQIELLIIFVLIGICHRTG